MNKQKKSRFTLDDWLTFSTILAIVLCSGILLWAGNTIFPDKVYIDKPRIITNTVTEKVPVNHYQNITTVEYVDKPVIVYRDRFVEVNKTVVVDLSKERLGDCIRLTTTNGTLLDCGSQGIYKWKN